MHLLTRASRPRYCPDPSTLLPACSSPARVEHSHWDAVAALVAAQPPRLLEDVPGLAAAAADAGRLDLMASLLASSSDMRAAELAAVLQVLLAPPSSAAATAGRQARHKAAAAAAAAAAKAAERAVAAAPQQLAAIQQQQQQQQPGGAGKKSKAARAKTKAAADGSDSDAEDLTAIAPAAYEPGAENGMHAAAVEQQAAVVLERRGEREQAVAACCRAAVEGLDAAQTCLHPVLTARSRAPVLLEALRSLPSQQAVALLRYLAVLLRNHTAMVGSLSAGWQPPLALPAHVALPTLQQALDWSSCLIDAALVKLSMEPEVGVGRACTAASPVSSRSSSPLLPPSGVLRCLCSMPPALLSTLLCRPSRCWQSCREWWSRRWATPAPSCAWLALCSTWRRGRRSRRSRRSAQQTTACSGWTCVCFRLGLQTSAASQRLRRNRQPLQAHRALPSLSRCARKHPPSPQRYPGTYRSTHRHAITAAARAPPARPPPPPAAAPARAAALLRPAPPGVGTQCVQ